ncbi:MAG: 50S ribosomal protein L6 [Chloroflexi bacterium]|nr:50S ribosomal protein L6 [Chloroflexota bacterium]
MSRIGRMPVPLPLGVQALLEETPLGTAATVRGPRGELHRTFLPAVTIRQEEGRLVVDLREEASKEAAIHGLSRALLNNMVVGVSQGYRRSLEIQGAGYRAQTVPEGLSLAVGFTHPVVIPALTGINFQVEQNTRVHVEGVDKELVGQTAARIRAVRPPQVYTGKGIRYLNEQVRRKAGKATGRRK